MQLFLGNCLSHRGEKFLPRAHMHGVAVHDYSVKIEDGASNHEKHLAIAVEKVQARTSALPGTSPAFLYPLRNPEFDTLPLSHFEPMIDRVFAHVIADYAPANGKASSQSGPNSN